jgi:hypothetical protein
MTAEGKDNQAQPTALPPEVRVTIIRPDKRERSGIRAWFGENPVLVSAFMAFFGSSVAFAGGAYVAEMKQLHDDKLASRADLLAMHTMSQRIEVANSAILHAIIPMYRRFDSQSDLPPEPDVGPHRTKFWLAESSSSEQLMNQLISALEQATRVSDDAWKIASSNDSSLRDDFLMQAANFDNYRANLLRITARARNDVLTSLDGTAPAAMRTDMRDDLRSQNEIGRLLNCMAAQINARFEEEAYGKEHGFEPRASNCSL